MNDFTHFCQFDQILCNAGLAKWQHEDVRTVAEKDKRILAAAGDQGDDFDGAKEMSLTFRNEGREDGKKGTACLIKGAIHAWNLQFPELFAEGFKAWTEEKPLPEGFVNLLDGSSDEGA
ncbi:hypothetical protein BFJ69_g17207 [Fusarium oxysporum]|uniref:Uncharacterized protein n=1 Tax=Fusarium oxysporum TaxID=5507 RepID=A0A420M8X3_FUSOX|nr:hypothetical protein BFJ69_g17207 [Fusarium oxysporum]